MAARLSVRGISFPCSPSSKATAGSRSSPSDRVCLLNDEPDAHGGFGRLVAIAAAKDLALIASLATDAGARMDQLTTNHRIVLEALSTGYADRDLSALAAFLRQNPA